MNARFRVLIVLLAAGGHGRVHADEPPKLKPVPPSATDARALARLLDKAYDDATPPEVARMLIAILRGSKMGPGEGWFGPGQTRYTWEWLAKLHDVDVAKGAISRTQFRGMPELFARLDRNKDGKVERGDLDWSDRSQYVQVASMINRMFRQMDPQGAGKMARDEWLAFFDKASGGKGYLSSEDMREALLAGFAPSFGPGETPDMNVLLRGLFAGEIGSFNEGPRIDQPAPNFVLKRQNGPGTLELARLTGNKPVVLVLGNFTCGPFRSFYPGVEDVYLRHKDRANFVMVYVREAHPTDGWKMESNTRVGVAVKQPTTFDERLGVAGQFCTKLKTNIPVVVDEMSDPVGHAYSGMPARLYVIDPQGKVAYKSGRGPFGFKSGEMEQALVMCVLEAETSAKPAPATGGGTALPKR